MKMKMILIFKIFFLAFTMKKQINTYFDGNFCCISTEELCEEIFDGAIHSSIKEDFNSVFLQI